LLHTTEGILYYTDDPSANPVVWTQIVTGVSSTSPFSYETFKGNVYLGNGVDMYARWNGTTYTVFPTAPRAKYLRLWKDTMWLAGAPSLPDRVYSSANGDAEDFSSAAFVDIGLGDGDSIHALTTDGQFLIVGKRDSTFTIYDPITFANRVVDFEKGFESHFAVAQYEGGIFFLSRRGICQYLGDSPSRVISTRLDPLFVPELIALDKLQQATAYVYQDRIGFAFPEVGQLQNSVVVEYYPRIAMPSSFGVMGIAPFVFHRMPTQVFTTWRWQSKEQLFASHNTANKWLHVFAPVGDDDGTAYTAVINTPFFDMGTQFETKYLRALRFLCAGRFNVLIFRNYDGPIYRSLVVDATIRRDYWDVSADLWGVGTWDFESLVQDLRKEVDAYGRCFSFQFRDAETGTTPRTVWVGATSKEVPDGEWALYGMFVEGVTLGQRS